MPGLANLEGTAQSRTRSACGTLIKARHYGAADPWAVIAIQLILVADSAPAFAVPVMHAISAELRASYFLANCVENGWAAAELLACVCAAASLGYQGVRLRLAHVQSPECVFTGQAHCYKYICLAWLIGVLVEHPSNPVAGFW